MHILFLTQVLPYPLDAGPKTRAYFVLRHLAGTGHRVTLLSFIRTSDSAEAVDHLATICPALHTVEMTRSRWRDTWHLSQSLPSATPFLIARDWSPAMANAVDDLCRQTHFDAVHADQLWMAPYALRAVRALRQKSAKGGRLTGVLSPPRAVLDQHNAVFQIPGRMAEQTGNVGAQALLALEARKLLRYEAKICASFDHVVWVTADDLAALRQQAVYHSPPAHDQVIPICVDPERQRPILSAHTPFRVTFLGGLHWPPNAAGVQWFLDKIWPQVLEAYPSARLTIIGKSPPAAMCEQASRCSHIELTGYVDDPTRLLAETAVFIVPLLAGGGMRVKILDAWQWGLPIVSTTIGAEGVAAMPGINLLLADEPAAFAAAVVRILMEPALAGRLRTAGRDTAETLYDWRTRYRQWDEIYGGPADASQQHGDYGVQVQQEIKIGGGNRA